MSVCNKNSDFVISGIFFNKYWSYFAASNIQYILVKLFIQYIRKAK